MNKKKVFQVRKKIDGERSHLKSRLEQLKIDERKLKKSCNHEIVLKFDTHEMHKIGKIYPCICAACKKSIDIVPYFRDIESTEFKNSTIIDLTESLDFNEKVNSLIDEISSNQNYYYDDSISLEEKTKKLKSKK